MEQLVVILVFILNSLARGESASRTWRQGRDKSDSTQGWCPPSQPVCCLVKGC